MKKYLIIIGYLLIAVLFLGIFASVDILRWQALQEATNSDISYLKYRFISSGR